MLRSIELTRYWRFVMVERYEEIPIFASFGQTTSMSIDLDGITSFTVISLSGKKSERNLSRNTRTFGRDGLLRDFTMGPNLRPMIFLYPRTGDTSLFTFSSLSRESISVQH